MRSDAARNRTRVLDTARRLVARDGAAVRMDDVAAEAGLAVGTLYRHFRTKEDLVAAVVEHSVAGIADRAEAAMATVEAGGGAWEALEQLARDIAASYATDRAVKAAAATLGAGAATTEGPDGSDGPAARAERAIERLLALAKVNGSVREDVTLEDLALVLAQVPDDPTGRTRDRYLAVVLRGLRPG